MLNDDLTAALHDEMNAGERILWSGRPRPGIVWRVWDIVLIPFSLMWLGFAVMWLIGVIATGAPLLFALWGIPFVLFGLFFVAGRFFLDASLRSRTLYALTNERIIILSGLFRRNITSLNLRSLPAVTLDARGDGRGTITFGPGRLYANMSFGMSRYAPPAFDTIDDARTVYRLILQAQSEKQ